MTSVAAAAEYKANVGHHFTLADAFDADFLDPDGETDYSRTRSPFRA